MRSIFLLVLFGVHAGAYAQGSDQAGTVEPVLAAPPPPALHAAPTDLRLVADPARLKLRSASLLVVDQQKGTALVARNPDAGRSIASITKLMTAMVVLDAHLPLEEIVTIGDADIDTLKGTASRLRTGTRLARRDLMRLALMSSENRAAAALARTYPEGLRAFVAAMNRKAEALGMTHTHFVDSTGLSHHNVSNAQDLVKMVGAAYDYPLIRHFTTTVSHTVNSRSAPPLAYRNSNRLVRSKDWTIGLSKTGYTAEAGRCLVMQAKIGERPVIIVLLDSWGKLTPIGDANRIRRWMEARLG